jgi:phosphoenolpyruvate synthase/pyruvate phosphate dikinase
MKSPYTLDFSDIRMSDVPRVGGKNASLGELFACPSPKLWEY